MHMLSVETIRQWSVQHSAPHMPSVHSDITPLLSPDDDIVNQMPVLGVRVPPRCLAAV